MVYGLLMVSSRLSRLFDRLDDIVRLLTTIEVGDSTLSEIESLSADIRGELTNLNKHFKGARV